MKMSQLLEFMKLVNILLRNCFIKKLPFFLVSIPKEIST